MHLSCTFAMPHVNDGAGANRHRTTSRGVRRSAAPSAEASTLPVHVPLVRALPTVTHPGEGGAAMTDVAAAPRIDGRTARATRTRSAIVDAHLALISEGDLKPTGERIAERAGVSLRALWANFKDMEALFAASGERLLQAAGRRAPARSRPTCRCPAGSRSSAGNGSGCSRSSRRRPGPPRSRSRSRWRCGATGPATSARCATELRGPLRGRAGRAGPGREQLAVRADRGQHLVGLVDAARRTRARRGRGAGHHGPHRDRAAPGRHRGRHHLTASGQPKPAPYAYVCARSGGKPGLV